MATKSRSGRPKVLNRAAKIVISKSLGKRRHSTRKIAKNLHEKGYIGSSATVYRHLKQSLGAKAFKRPKIPRITEKIKENAYCLPKITNIGLWRTGGRYFGLTNPHFRYFPTRSDYAGSTVFCALIRKMPPVLIHQLGCDP